MLRASVLIQGHLTTTALRRYLASPIFLLLRHPELPTDPIRWGAGVGIVVGAAAVAGIRLIFGRWTRALAWGMGLGVAAGLVTMLALGLGALRNSLFLAVSVGLISTGLGFVFALLESRSTLWTRRLLAPLSILPIITPAFVLGLAMIYMFGRRGFVTHTLLGLSTNVFFGPLGVGVAQVLAFTPIAYLVLVGVIHSLDVSLEEAARTLRADRWTLFRTILWPLMRPGLANAILLVMIESLADFGNPLLLGGGVPFLPTEIFYAIEGRFDQHEAAVYGVVLLVITLTIFFLQRYWLGRRSYVTVTGKPSGGRPTPLPLATDLVLTGVFLLFTAVAALLYGSILFGSFVKLWGIDNTFTLKNYQDLMSHGVPVLFDTMRLSLLAAIPSAGFGVPDRLPHLRHRFFGRTALEFSAMLSYAIPGTVMGIGYILAFNAGALQLTGTGLIIILAFIFRGMPVGIRSGVAALTQLDPSLEEASSTLKAGTATTLRRVVIPLIRSAIITGLIYSFVRAMTAVSQVIFLVSPGHDLVTVLILSWAEYGTIGRGAALSTLLILVLAACILPAQWLSRRRPIGVTAGAVSRAPEGGRPCRDSASVRGSTVTHRWTRRSAASPRRDTTAWRSRGSPASSSRRESGGPAQASPRPRSGLTASCIVPATRRDLAHPDPAIRADAVGYVMDCLRFAAEIGAPLDADAAPRARPRLAPARTRAEEWAWSVAGDAGRRPRGGAAAASRSASSP